MKPADRRRAIIAEWRTAQGERGAAGVPEVLRALEHIAALRVAGVREGQTLRLTQRDLRLARHAAISQARKRQHGNIPTDPGVWWEQISSIAALWGIETTYDDWTRMEAEGPPEGPAPARYSAMEAA